MSRRRRILVGLVVVLVAGAVVAGFLRRGRSVGSGPGDGTVLRSQDFSRDPRWQGFQNRRLGRCTRTRQAFGRRRGSIGGLVTRAARPAWYGHTVSLSFERPFVVAGSLLVAGQRDEAFPGGSALIGAFNSASRDWRPPNLIAFQLNGDPVGGGDYSIALAYGARDYQTAHVAYGGARRPTGFRYGRRYGWRLSYDPSGAGGRGEATLSIPRAGPSARLALTPGARRAGATLDRLGISNQTVARGRGLDLELGGVKLDGVTLARSVGAGAWQSHGSHTAYRDCLTGQPNSFGWARRDRRLGGVVSRTDERQPDKRAFYADRVGQLTLDDRLHAQGTVTLARANSDSATLLGWFRRGSHGGGSAELAPPEFVGVAITGPSRIGQYLSPLIADRHGRVAPDDGTGIVLNPGPAIHRWSFDYTPGAGRAGVIEIRLDQRRVSWPLPRKLRLAGARFNRFGIRNVERGGSFQFVYFDDLRYTIDPRPPARSPRRSRG